MINIKNLSYNSKCSKVIKNNIDDSLFNSPFEFNSNINYFPNCNDPIYKTVIK
jgi:hypothetical protein